MKAAFHFNIDHPSLTGDSGWDVDKMVFTSLLRHRNLNICSKIFAGLLPILELARKEMFEPEQEDVEDSNLERFKMLVKYWLRPENPIRKTIDHERFLHEVLNHNLYAVCFESIEFSLVEYLHKQIAELTPAYIGVIEVDDESPVHWFLYSDSLMPIYRIINRTVTIFWDNLSEADRPKWLVEACQELGFKASFEGLNGRYTIFDKYDNFEHARRVAEWKRRCGNMLAFIADNVVHRLEDAAPELGEKLLAAILTLEGAEIDEQYAQVAVSCRRIVEYVIDELVPPTKKQSESHKKEFRERLLAFAGEQRRNNEEDIDLVCISNETLEEQIKKLSSLANKGVHREIYRDEARRCLLRTIILLDDIISLKPSAFEIRPGLDIDIHDIRNWL